MIFFFVCSGSGQQSPSQEAYNGFLIDKVTGKRQAAIKHLMVQLMRDVVDYAYIEKYLESQFPYPHLIDNQQMGKDLKKVILKSKKRGGSFYNGISNNFGKEAFRTIIENIPKKNNYHSFSGFEDEKFISFVSEYWSYRFSPPIRMDNEHFVIVMKDLNNSDIGIAYIVSCDKNQLKSIASYYLNFSQ
ncbi:MULTISPECIES: hypothetical protein [Flavobacteriaceae]|uniref:hypothetical protein n=1 Tax=Flavobacteriaceae TaxID=49546 RepID=UPI0014928A4F|nr:MULTISPECIES: hypothetical protein [Allomuricauda]MDC6367210.1 hypothetical protein [Muricauda sp. AC10]